MEQWVWTLSQDAHGRRCSFWSKSRQLYHTASCSGASEPADASRVWVPDARMAVPDEIADFCLEPISAKAIVFFLSPYHSAFPRREREIERERMLGQPAP